MKIKENKIIRAPEDELLECYLRKGYDDVMPFAEYKRRCVEAGTEIVRKDEGE